VAVVNPAVAVVNPLRAAAVPPLLAAAVPVVLVPPLLRHQTKETHPRNPKVVNRLLVARLPNPEVVVNPLNLVVANPPNRLEEEENLEPHPAEVRPRARLVVRVVHLADRLVRLVDVVRRPVDRLVLVRPVDRLVLVRLVDVVRLVVRLVLVHPVDVPLAAVRLVDVRLVAVPLVDVLPVDVRLVDRVVKHYISSGRDRLSPQVFSFYIG